MENIIVSLNELFKQLYLECATLIEPATLVCGFATLMYFCVRLWATWGRGKAIDPMDYLKPFGVLLAITFFPALISGMESTLNIVTASTEIIVAKQQNDLKSLVLERTKLREKLVSENARYKQYDTTENVEYTQSKGVYDPELALKSNKSWLAEKIQEVLIWLLQYLFIILRTGMQTLSILFRIILALIGPFVFAFSLFPTLEGNIGSWFARYINVYLYIPIANILGLVQTKLFIIQNQTAINALNSGTYQYGMEDLSFILVLGFSIIGWFQIPTIASWVIQSTGAGSYLGKVNETAAKGAQMTGKGAQAAGKKAPAAARGATRAIGGAFGKLFN